ncbi:hypothetical protein LTR10_021989 [Elasticomyces elasticus]|uniref:Small ribosomal subunit protein uS7 domain-containing protein n=1 Tax=Exophiala sideris TaxID=1016849 RepID=A0ABR0JC45_9EURO|nr:hypothetical protein LTR10_021989 [Elasticomyces elasticus]KAK5030647.1 hypothetical protein LTS07_005431 [Exophiala sideris]KAK5038701.1 hypothetical protein LTR13_004448 [Exophiala sideris]KAK5060582.1 hypothetical protein LTR69_005899 [Exophiala sideris]KAK5183494.1 hypothetical protein LTR44_004495 [Eurotiomycetes sp. CCFEE 6388]
MPPRISLFTARSVPFRTKPSIPQKRFAPSLVSQRKASDDASTKTTPVDPNVQTPEMESNMHVTEEQAAMDKIQGNTPPDIEQGTPVQEILQRDKDAQDKAPKVLKQDIKNNQSTGTPSGTRSFSTSARRPAEVASEMVSFEDTRVMGLEYPDAGFGHKFALPDISSWQKSDNMKKRYDPVVQQVTRSLMRHGKLSKAQTNMAIILNTLRTAPVPGGDASAADRTLLSDVPRDALPLEPVKYLTAVVDSVAPLVKIRQQKGVLGGGQSMPIPVPLSMRQRRRTAIQWILMAAENRRELALAERVAKEIINVAEGRSGAWERRQRVHKMAISARANIRAGIGGGNVRVKQIRGK